MSDKTLAETQAPKPWIIDQLLRKNRELQATIDMHVADIAALRAKNEALEARIERPDEDGVEFSWYMRAIMKEQDEALRARLDALGLDIEFVEHGWWLHALVECVDALEKERVKNEAFITTIAALRAEHEALEKRLDDVMEEM